MSGPLARLVGAPAETAETFGDPPGEPDLFPAEAAAVARAVPKRRAEYATVRACARTALARLGAPRVPLLPGERGAPGWPPGFVGSMTHCAGYRGAAVARAADLAGIGIDAEPADPLPDPGILPLISLPEERAMLTELAARRPGVAWDRLLFSAKESVYKAWFPLTRRWLDFGEAGITIDPDTGTFTARLLPEDAPLRTFPGRWTAGGGLLLTAVVLPA
ncbi:4'-phosphopantetheinyl transferase superfamily protein [Streptomyces sp. RFCAC02]|uniref:4'-phosphopantetheinyl transferase family protein n=1 Tax=Streptomyces sp. RFCAC02 TaxID=2499143 RepID=UPI001F0D2A4D|nr:4'-phosphopantetheinyl transferase superfamily protein [Streptomyces sp. RFCAC02]